jgi:hypothetical protein
LIELRIEKNASSICSKRGMAKVRWQEIANILKCRVTREQYKKKWNNLIARYKKILCPPTGEGLEGEEHEADAWEYFETIHKFMSNNHIIKPFVLIQSSSSGSSTSQPSTSASLNGRPTTSKSFRAPLFNSDTDDESIDDPVIKRKRSKSSAGPASLSLKLIKDVRDYLNETRKQQEESLQNERELKRYIKKKFEKE